MIALNKVTRVSFEDITHSYLLDDTRELIGVTSLMRKHGLSPDYSGIPEEVMQKAAERGSKVHKDIEDYCNGKEVVMTPELKAYIGCNVKPVANEYLVTDYAVVASSIDIVADAGDGKVYLIDIKTTSTLHHEALSWQLSIYAYLFQLINPDIEIAGIYGLHIRNGKAQLVPVARKKEGDVKSLLLCEHIGERYMPSQEKLPTATTTMLAELEQVSEKITLVKASLKELEEIEKSVKDRLLQEMEQNALKTLENGPLKVTYVAPYTKEAVDTKKLKEVMPEIYEKYKKVSKIGASLKITIKN